MIWPLRLALLTLGLPTGPLGATECVSGSASPQGWQVALMQDTNVACSGVVVAKSDLKDGSGGPPGTVRVVIATAAHCLPESTHLRWLEANGSLSVAGINIRDGGRAVEPLDPSHKGYDVAFLRLLLTSSDADRFSVIALAKGGLTESAGRIWRVLPSKTTDAMSVPFTTSAELKSHTEKLPGTSTRLTSGIGLKCSGLERSNSGSPVTVHRNGLDELVGVLSTISMDPDGDGPLPPIAQVQSVLGVGPWDDCWTALRYPSKTWDGIVEAEPKCAVWPAIRRSSRTPSIFKMAVPALKSSPTRKPREQSPQRH